MSERSERISGPLDGVRVLEFAGIGPCPFAVMMLADMGAAVIRVDRIGPPSGEYTANPVLERGRRSIAVDLKQPYAQDVVRRLVEQTDVLVEGFRPGVMERLGIGPSECLAVNPALVYGRMTGWGQGGPRASDAGHDINYIGLAGALHAIGRAGGPPQPPLNLVGDFGGGAMFLAFGIVCALLEARRSGHGQVVDASVVDGTTTLLGLVFGLQAVDRWVDERGHNLLDTGCPYYDVYECADGGYVAVGTIERKFFANALEVLGLDRAEWLPSHGDRARWPALRAALTEAFRSATRDEWAERFAGREACVTPVLSLAEARRDPHAVARGLHIPLPDSDAVQPAPAPRFSRTVPTLDAPAPQPGEHTAEILRELGVDAGESAALVDRGAVATAPLSRGRRARPTASPGRPG
jgi:alpha-methylacyl-CoA racemase